MSISLPPMLRRRNWPQAGFLLTLGLLLSVAAAATTPPAATRISANPDFAHGLNGWSTTGAVHLEQKPPDQAGAEIVIGPGAGSIRQRMAADGNNHMMVSVLLHAKPAGSAVVTVRFFDKAGHELMSLRSPTDIRPGKTPGSMEEYFRPHPLTAAVDISVSNDNSPGTVTVERAELDQYHDDDPTLRSSQDTAALMRPFWQGTQVADEAVLLISDGNGPATGTLMFQPDKILSVTSYDGAVQYREGVDYRVDGRTLTVLADSAISQIHDSDLKQGELAWNVIGGKQILVTYEHSDRWPGSVQAYVGAQLPRTMRLLREHQALRIVAFGDSITYGIGSSHMDQIPPTNRHGWTCSQPNCGACGTIPKSRCSTPRRAARLLTGRARWQGAWSHPSIPIWSSSPLARTIFGESPPPRLPPICRRSCAPCGRPIPMRSSCWFPLRASIPPIRPTRSTGVG